MVLATSYKTSFLREREPISAPRFIFEPTAKIEKDMGEIVGMLRMRDLSSAGARLLSN
jgi:hypothetical protein